MFWSLNVVKWKIWAYENVRNVNELKRKAIEQNLIWNDSSWFNKTEIINAKQKQRLIELEEKFLIEDEFFDDEAIPEETLIYFPKFNNYLELGISFLILALAIYLSLIEEKEFNIVGYILLAVSLYFFIPVLKKITSKKPQLTTSSKHICFTEYCFDWKDIDDAYVISDQNENLIYISISNVTDTFNLEGLDKNSVEIEHLINVYRVRFEKES